MRVPPRRIAESEILHAVSHSGAATWFRGKHSIAGLIFLPLPDFCAHASALAPCQLRATHRQDCASPRFSTAVAGISNVLMCTQPILSDGPRKHCALPPAFRRVYWLHFRPLTSPVRKVRCGLQVSGPRCWLLSRVVCVSQLLVCLSRPATFCTLRTWFRVASLPYPPCDSHPVPQLDAKDARMGWFDTREVLLVSQQHAHKRSRTPLPANEPCITKHPGRYHRY